MAITGPKTAAGRKRALANLRQNKPISEQITHGGDAATYPWPRKAAGLERHIKTVLRQATGEAVKPEYAVLIRGLAQKILLRDSLFEVLGNSGGAPPGSPAAPSSPHELFLRYDKQILDYCNALGMSPHSLKDSGKRRKTNLADIINKR